jgi:hypothetical protein
MILRLIPALLLLAAQSLLAHRLDEYLQNTLVSIEKDRLIAEMTLTPGMAVLPVLMTEIDINSDGVISAAEQGAYAARVLHDLSLTVDGRPLALRVVSFDFPEPEGMKEGLGEIHINFEAELPGGSRTRNLELENHHLPRISAYQVNCLVSRDPGIRILAQRRNFIQSLYHLDYAQTVPTTPLWSGGLGLLAPFALLFLARLVLARICPGTD